MPTLAELIIKRQDELLGLWRTAVRHLPSAQGLDTPTLTDHVPRALEDVVSRLRAARFRSLLEIHSSLAGEAHAASRLQHGFDIEEVLMEYGLLQEQILDLAVRHDVAITPTDYRILINFFHRSALSTLRVFLERRSPEP